MTNTKKITFTAIGIALYVVLSMSMKIPLIAHISLDLGYIAFALYCYHFGAISGMIVGGVGCVLISLITTGWFPPGWFLGNLVIGVICGCLYRHDATINNIIITIIAVAIGILGIKTVIECKLYSIPYTVKIPKNAIAFITDAIVMSAGTLFARNKTIERICHE